VCEREREREREKFAFSHFSCPAIPQLQYSPDAWLFPALKNGLSVCFASVEEIQQNVTVFSQPYQKRISRGVSSNGRTAGVNVYVQRGSNLKVTRLGFIHVLCTTNCA
jgi:hypothetical protein